MCTVDDITINYSIIVRSDIECHITETMLIEDSNSFNGYIEGLASIR